jgi:hypothetical protein
MKDLTCGVYTFEKLIEGNYLYIDKTEYLWKLVRPASGIYFLSRPRRFGKSLTLSTLKALFEGKKHLFTGLAIAKTAYKWQEYPVIHLDLNGWDFSTPEIMQASLCGLVAECAAKHGISLLSSTPDAMFRELITRMSAKEKVVILVDEYDKPILNNIGKPCAQEILSKLKAFYSVIKAFEASERFVFVTGVSKFSHVSIFSDLNNLNDISMDYDYATMLGYTQEEMETNFAEHIDRAFKALKISREKLLQEIKTWYDGYRFEENSPSVYNPVSIANFFLKRYKFNNYWFDTGTPSFLLELIKRTQFDFENILSRPVSGMAFKAFEIEQINPLPILLQTGYLTIKDSFQDFGSTFYQLDFPNFEVRSAFDTYLLNAYTSIPKDDLEMLGLSLAQHVRNGNVDGFMNDLKSFLKKIPYGIQLAEEKYYQTIIFLVFLLLGIHIEAESQTSDGRIDAVAICGDWVYLFEFKLNQSAEIAFDQIMRKEYFHKYLHTGKRTIAIGANLDFATRQMTAWKHQEIQS